jgi:hypothetical protein
MKYLLIAVAALFFIGILAGGSESATDAYLDDMQVKVAEDAVAQYRIAERSGTMIDRCVQAGFVTAAWLQAQDEAQYSEWKGVELSDCKAAGVPR